MAVRDPESGLHACVVRTLLSEPSQQPTFLSSETHFIIIIVWSTVCHTLGKGGTVAKMEILISDELVGRAIHLDGE